MENLQDLCHYLQFLELRTLHHWIYKNKGLDLSHKFFVLKRQTITYVDSMLSEYEALSILMYMKIFLSQILSYVNDILNLFTTLFSPRMRHSRRNCSAVSYMHSSNSDIPNLFKEAYSGLWAALDNWSFVPALLVVSQPVKAWIVGSNCTTLMGRFWTESWMCEILFKWWNQISFNP